MKKINNSFILFLGPRLCQASLGPLPCFQNTRTSSPTIIDAYQTSFLQCVVQNYNRNEFFFVWLNLNDRIYLGPVTVFWVVGNETGNNVLITDYLSTNQYRGDRLRRVFPLSPFDYSIELTIHRDTHERSYSCVIDGAAGIETTLFTYIVRSLGKLINIISIYYLSLFKYTYRSWRHL